MALLQLLSAPGLVLGAGALTAYACALQKGIMKLRKLLEGEKEEQFTAEQYMMLYTYVPRQGCCAPASLLPIPCDACLLLLMLLCRMIYNMCTQKPPNDYSEQLYTRYRDSFSLYISEKARE